MEGSRSYKGEEGLSCLFDWLIYIRFLLLRDPMTTSSQDIWHGGVWRWPDIPRYQWVLKIQGLDNDIAMNLHLMTEHFLQQRSALYRFAVAG